MDAGGGDDDVEMPHLEEYDETEEHQHDDGGGGGEEEEGAGELEAHYDDDENKEHLEDEDGEVPEEDEGGEGGGNIHDGEEEDNEQEHSTEQTAAKTENELFHEAMARSSQLQRPGLRLTVDTEEEEEDEENEVPPPNISSNNEEDRSEEDESMMVDKHDDEESTFNNNNQDEADEQSDAGGAKRKRSASQSSVDEEGSPKRKQVRSSGSVSGQKHDTYCWVCHKDGVQAVCKICPRSYHTKCMHTSSAEDSGKAAQQQQSELPTKTCICPECAIVMNAENLETRSETMKNLTIDQLIIMLKYACQRMKATPGAEPFVYPVDPVEAIDYFQYVVYPMDLTTLENNVKKREYGSTEAFLADAQWLVHNSVVFNSATSPFTATAKKILKVCRQEIQDIETCPECYINAHDKPQVWFLEVCRRPHILVWAKLKGFPFWPAKCMKIKDEMVDVRFFGAHDRAWVVRSSCYLYSEQNPGAPPKKNAALSTSLEELNAHVEKLKDHHGPVVFSAARTRIGPQISLEAIREMLPEYKPPEDSPVSINKSSTTSGGQGLSQQSAKKSPMTIRISSLKTNPTIVTNSVVEEGGTEGKLRFKNASGSDKDKSVTSENEDGGEKLDNNPVDDDDEEEDQEEEHQQQQNSGEEEDQQEMSTTATTTLSSAKPSGGILATALAGRLATRRSSRSESESASPPGGGGGGGDQRMLRAVLAKQSESGGGGTEDGGGSSSRDNNTPPPPKSFLSSLGLMKSSDVVVAKKPISQLGKLLHPSEVFVKQEEEQEDEGDEEDYGDGGGGGPSSARSKPNELGNQQGGGMRFNLSKDISISPVGDDSGEDHHHHHSQQQQHPQQRRLIQGHNARGVPGLIPQQNAQMMGGRPRPMMNINGGGGGGMTQQQRLQHQQQQQQQRGMMMRPRPGGGPMRAPAGMMRMNGPPRPQSMQMMQQRQQQQHGQKPKDVSSNMMIDSSSLQQAQGAFTNAVQLNQVHSIQGAVTLPGGTITVTPLQPVIGITDGLNGGQMILKQNITTSSSNGLPISVLTPHDGGAQSLLKSNNKPNPQRRNLMNQVPPAVGHLVQNLQKTLVENVKTTMEQIVVEMIEKANSSGGGGPEAKALKDENERLKKQVGEYKHNQDSMTRELKEALIADKKRALAELRKQLEQEKNKAIEETKRRQWCARCSREAQFYCCWNTSYCGYSCQEDHWPSHMNSCSQSTGGGRQ